MVDCNLKDFPDHTLKLNNIKTLVLDNNPIASINECESALGNMHELSIKSCLITDFSGGKVHNTQYLNTSNNAIQYFPTNLGESIVVLNLNYNQLDMIPEEISHLRNLTALDVWTCGLKEFPKPVLTLENLRRLNIKENFIHVILNDIVKLDLTELLIGQNTLDEFPNCLHRLLNLAVIDLSSCFLDNFPLMTQNLSKLVLNDNCITDIPEDISHFKVEKIFMKDNPVNKLPDSFQCLTELKSIDFSSTNLEIIPCQILNLSNLKKLKMRNNAIEKLPGDWNQCVNTTHLDLSQNPLILIPSSVAQLQKLQMLRLESCCLSDFPVVLLKFQALEDLDLGHNLLSSLPDNIDQLHLKRLNIQHNLLQNLP